MVTSTPTKVAKGDETSDTDVVFSSYFIVTNSTLVEFSSDVEAEEAEEQTEQNCIGGLDKEIQQIGQVSIR